MPEPLYLKYRPQKLSELVGQEVIARTLTNAIKFNKVAHAYFLTGPRGCGKTSTARIIAKSLNCKQGPTLDPCGVCGNCREIAMGISPDVIEMDAASHRSVEDATQVIERSHLAPQTAKHKIYILDEVHMLSKEAFNALLKTIEEPPENVIFILATTEEHKVPPTIVSRCQKFSFRPIDFQPLIERLKYISEIEQILLTESCFQLIAKHSKGGLRDALSLLDQISVLGSPGETIQEKLILDLFGSISVESLNQLLKLMIDKNYKEALSVISTFLQDGIDPLQLIRNLVEFSVDKLESILSSNVKDIPESSKIDTIRLIEIIDGLSKSEYSLRNAGQPALKLKSVILSICALSSTPENTEQNTEQNMVSASNFIQRLEYLEKQLKTLSANQNTLIETKLVSASKSQIVKEQILTPVVTPHQTDYHSETTVNQPHSLLNVLMANLKHPPTKALISKVFVLSETPNSAILGVSQETFYNKLNDPKKIKIIEDTILEAISKPYTIRIELAENPFPETVSKQEEVSSQIINNEEFTDENKKKNNNVIISKKIVEINSSNVINSDNIPNNVLEAAQYILGAKVINRKEY